MNLWNSVRIEPKPCISVDYAGQGDLVIFLHGLGGSKYSWRSNVPVFAEYFQVLAWDARGWGDSDQFDGPLTFHDMSNDLLRVIDHFGAERAHLVGISMGALNAMHFAEMNPARVASLVLCGTMSGLSMRQVTNRVLSRPVALVQLIGDILVRNWVRRRTNVKAIKMLLRSQYQPKLSEIVAPTLVAVGALDKVTPISDAQEIAGVIPRATLAIISEAGHLTNIENPVEFNDVVIGFLTRNRNHK